MKESDNYNHTNMNKPFSKETKQRIDSLVENTYAIAVKIGRNTIIALGTISAVKFLMTGITEIESEIARETLEESEIENVRNVWSIRIHWFLQRK